MLKRVYGTITLSKTSPRIGLRAFENESQAPSEAVQRGQRDGRVNIEIPTKHVTGLCVVILVCCRNRYQPYNVLCTCRVFPLYKYIIDMKYEE